MSHLSYFNWKKCNSTLASMMCELQQSVTYFLKKNLFTIEEIKNWIKLISSKKLLSESCSLIWLHFFDLA